MAKPPKFTPARETENRDRKRDRDGWKAARTAARKAKAVRRDFERGE